VFHRAWDKLSHLNAKSLLGVNFLIKNVFLPIAKSEGAQTSTPVNNFSTTILILNIFSSYMSALLLGSSQCGGAPP